MNNISAVNFEAKAPKTRINWARSVNNVEYKVDKELKDLVEQGKPNLEKEAKKYNAEVTLAQKANSLFINSGAVTTYKDFSKKNNANEVYQAIVDNIHANAETSKGISRVLKTRRK